MPAGVCIHSLLSHADKDTFYDIFILCNEDFADSRIRLLPQQFPHCRITFRSVGNLFDDAYEIRGITKETYYKLYIPELIPEYDKVIYSDVDVIFREDLADVYDTDLGNCFFAAVDAFPVLNEDYLAYHRTIGLDPESDGYFYAGNLIVNSRLIREKNLIPRFLGHLHKPYRFQEMDIINLECRKNIKPLPPAFCLTGNYYEAIVTSRERLKNHYSDEELEHALKNGIVHYNGPKPWKEVCLNMDIWWDYYRRSVFFDEAFALGFWHDQTYRIEIMSLWKRIKQVARYFRKGGRK